MEILLQFHRIIDLSHTLHPNIPQWPGDPGLEFEEVANLERDGFYLRRFSLGEHSGTHVNAPAGFHAGGAGIDQYPPSAFVAPAIVIDVRERAAANPDYRLGVNVLLGWEQEHGSIPAGSIALLHTGWQEKWDDPPAYLGNGGGEALHFPGFGVEALGVLLTQRGAAGIGIDTHGVDGGRDTTFSINRRTLERQRIVLENLCNLDQLPPLGATLVIGALRLQGGSGAPASVLAFIP
jgi:kynurenine formamidase